MADPVEVAEWRLEGAARWLQLALGALTIVTAVLRVLFGGLGPSSDPVIVTVLNALAGVLGLVLIVYVLRVRVRALDDRVEIRGLRTRTIPYADIGEVKLNRFTGYQSVNLVLTDGRIVAPLAPRAAGPEVMAAAVEAIEYRRLLAQGRPGEADPRTTRE